ncbi:hypothetical protein F5Y10DRAFT_238070 [Nemania abortiva]|nr:hypothetical protein F5Y10DRAFT_238070 [Nemania abortiva]
MSKSRSLTLAVSPFLTLLLEDACVVDAKVDADVKLSVADGVALFFALELSVSATYDMTLFHNSVICSGSAAATSEQWIAEAGER